MLLFCWFRLDQTHVEKLDILGPFVDDDPSNFGWHFYSPRGLYVLCHSDSDVTQNRTAHHNLTHVGLSNLKEDDFRIEKWSFVANFSWKLTNLYWNLAEILMAMRKKNNVNIFRSIKFQDWIRIIKNIDLFQISFQIITRRLFKIGHKCIVVFMFSQNKKFIMFSKHCLPLS